MLYDSPWNQPDYVPRFGVHEPMRRAPEGHLMYGICVATADELEEALKEARRLSNVGREGHFVSDGWNVWHV